MIVEPSSLVLATGQTADFTVRFVQNFPGEPPADEVRVYGPTLPAADFVPAALAGSVLSEWNTDDTGAGAALTPTTPLSSLAEGVDAEALTHVAVDVDRSHGRTGLRSE